MYVATHERGWRNDRHVQQWGSSLDRYVMPTLGDMPVGDVGPGDVAKIVEPLWLCAFRDCPRQSRRRDGSVSLDGFAEKRNHVLREPCFEFPTVFIPALDLSIQNEPTGSKEFIHVGGSDIAAPATARAAGCAVLNEPHSAWFEYARKFKDVRFELLLVNMDEDIKGPHRID
jgi:hypothetical protein